MNLIQCVRDNDVKALKTLIAERVNVDAMDEEGRTALWYAANRDHVDCATALLDAKADVNKANILGDSPLHRVSYHGSVEFVRVRRLCGLVGRGCLNVTEVTPLCALQLLIKHNANVNVLDNYGNSPLHLASYYGHLACVQVRLPPLCILVNLLLICAHRYSSQLAHCVRGIDPTSMARLPLPMPSSTNTSMSRNTYFIRVQRWQMLIQISKSQIG
jgi:ankyrin repeat protein